MQGLLQWVKSTVGDTVGKSISSALKWGLLILCALAALSLHTWWKQKKVIKRIKSHCASAQNDTIFVVLLGECSAKTTAQSLYSIFEKASCPTRVTVGLYEFLDHEDAKTGGALSLYKSMAQRHGSSGLSYESQVTSMMRLKSDQGPYAAIFEIIQHLLKKEKFVFVFNDSLQLLSGWDSIALNALAQKDEKSIIIQHDSSSFPLLSEFKEGVPEITFKEFYSPDSVQVSFWSRCSSFSSSLLWKDLPNNRNRFKHIIYGVDVLISLESRNLGWTFYSSSSPFVTRLTTSKSIFKSHKKRIHEDLDQYLKNKFAKELKEIDLLPPGRKALMGVCDEQDEQEIVAKYGSIAEFLYLAGN